MASGYDVYSSAEFQEAIEKCQIFWLKGPRGGHYNDGFELLGRIKCGNPETLFSYLDALGVKVTLHKEEPDCWCPPPVFMGGSNYWIEYENRFEIRGINAVILIATTTLELEFNLNSTSWYDVTVDDVKRAIKFEKILAEKNIVDVD